MNEMADSRDEALAEPPEVQERNLWLGVRVLAGVTVMFFLAFVFAYFYLRSLNNGNHGGRWRPPSVDPQQAYGAVIVGLFVLSAALFAYADRAARSARSYLPAAGLALALGLAGCVVQGFEYTNLGFTPLQGGYASVFLGWTLLFTVFALFALYWLEIVFATGLRHRAAEAYVPQGIDEASFYWTLLVVLGAIAWVILYLL
jgi:heme/copper-type cytochrome/quinol oxidase subunit 3